MLFPPILQSHLKSLFPLKAFKPRTQTWTSQSWHNSGQGFTCWVLLEVQYSLAKIHKHLRGLTQIYHVRKLFLTFPENILLPSLRQTDKNYDLPPCCRLVPFSHCQTHMAQMNGKPEWPCLVLYLGW